MKTTRRRVFTDEPEVIGGKVEGVTPPKLAAAVGEDDGEERREAAFYAAPEWQGKELVLTSSRWGLILQQRAAVTDLPFLDALVGDAWFSDAVRLLYFCSTGPDDWAAFRKDSVKWQEEIERWGDRHAPVGMRLEVEKKAFELYRLANVNRHEVAPPEKGAIRDAGN